ncbi:complex I NDUFA9 subunit family protein [Proteobacteria bacterium 005FR1]|nr:complex I NDUFA9 subunit family protein [Proteobacteria bacterium 005FR1]
MAARVVTVFGGTGFLGQRVVRALLAAGATVRVAARHPDLKDFPDAGNRAVAVKADILDDHSVAEALNGAEAAVNAVSLWVEKGPVTFDAVHVHGAARVARLAKGAGLKRLVHVSGIGVDRDSSSPFVRARALGERAVLDNFERSTIVRPSVMFHCREGFVTALDQATRMPVVPLFGRGETRLQPAFVEDVATAVVRLLENDTGHRIVELGGGKVYTYREAAQLVAAHLGRRRQYLPWPFALWHPLVRMLAVLPNPPLTRDQLVLMENDNVTHEGTSGFADLGITPKSLETVLADCPRS